MNNYCQECRMMYIHNVKCSRFGPYPTMQQAFDLSKVRTRIKFVVTNGSSVKDFTTYVASEAIAYARELRDLKAIDVQIHEKQEVF